MQDNETLQFDSTPYDSSPKPPPERIDDNPLDGDYGNYTWGQLQNDKSFNDAVNSKDSKSTYRMYHAFKQGLKRRLVNRGAEGELTIEQIDGKLWNALEYEKTYMKKAGLDNYEPLMENGNFTPPSLDNLELRTLFGGLAPEMREIIRSKVGEEAAAKKPGQVLESYKDLLYYEDPETGKRESLLDAWSINRWGEEGDPDGERMERWRKEATKYGESRGISPDAVLNQIAELVMKQEFEEGRDTRLSTDNGVSIGGGLYVNSGAVVIGSPTSVEETGAVLGMLNDSSVAKQAILKSSATDNQKLRGLRVLGAVRENLAFQLWTDTIIAGYGDNRSASEAILKNIATSGLYSFLAEDSDDFSRFEENYKPKWENKNGSVTRKSQKDYRTDLTIAFALERHENAGLWAGLEDNVFATVDTGVVSGGVDLTLGVLDAFEGLQGLQKKLYGVEGSDAIQGMQDDFRGSLIEAKDSVQYVNDARQRIRKLDYGKAGNFIAEVSSVVGYAVPAVVATAVVSRVAAPMAAAGGTATIAKVGKYSARAMTSLTQGLTTAAQAYSSSTYSTYQKLLDKAYDEGVKLTPAKQKELWQTAGQSAVGGAAANGALTMAVTALAGPIGRGMGVSGDTVLGKAGKLGSGTLDDTTLMTMLLSSSSRGAVLRQAKGLLRDKKVRGLFMDAIKNSDKKLIGGMKDWGKRQVFDKASEGIEEGLAGGAQALLDAIGEQKLGFENDGLFDTFTSSFAEEAVMGIAASVPMNSVMGNTAAAKAYFSDKNNINTAIGKVFARNKAFAAKLEGIKGGVDESTAYEALAGLKKNGELEAAKALEVIVKESKVSPPRPAPQGRQQPPPMPGTSGGTKKSERVGNMQGSSGTVNIDIKKGDERMDTLEEVDHPVYGIGRYSQVKSVGSENIIGKGVVYSQAKDKASLAAQPKVSEPNERGETTVTYQVAYRESSEGKRAKYKPTDRQVELIVDQDGVVISSKIGALMSTTPQVKPTVTQKNQAELHTTPQDSKAVEEGRLYTVLSKFTPLSRATVAQVSRGNSGRAFLGALRSIIGRTIPSTFSGKYMTEKPISVSDARSQLDTLEEGLNEGAYEGLTPQEKNQLVRSINDVRERLDQFESDPLPFYGGDAKSLLARTAMASIEAREAGKLNSSHVDEKAYKAALPRPIPVKKPLPTPPPRKEQSNAEPQPEPESGTEPEPESPDLATENDTVNVWAGTGENTILSNLSSRPFQYNGRDYLSVEHAYQTLKSGEFDQETYDAYNKEGAGKKIIGKKPVNKAISEALMENLIEASMMQNESARNALLATGDATITHTQEKSGIWGDVFPRILMDVRERLRSEQQVQSTTEEQTDQASETTEPIIGDLVTNPDGSQSMFLGEGVYVSIPNEQQAIGEVSDFTNAVKRAGLNLESVITSKVYEILDGLGDDGSFPVTVVVDNTIPSAAELAYPEGVATSGVIRINLEQMNQLRMANPSLVAKGILHEIHHVATIRQYIRENGGAKIAIEKIAELGRQVKANDNASTMLREGYPTTTELSDVNAGLEYLAVLHERVLTGDSVADAYRTAGLLYGENMTIIERWLNAAKRMAEAMFGMKDIPGVSDMLKRIELSLRASEAYKAEQSALASRVQQSRVQLSNSLKEMVANVEEAANQVSPPTPPEPTADSRTRTQPKKKDIIFNEIVEDDVAPPEELPPTQSPLLENKKDEERLVNEAQDSEYLQLAKDPEENKSRMREILDTAAKSKGALILDGSMEFVRGGFEKGLTKYKGSSFWTINSAVDVAEMYSKDASLGISAITDGRKAVLNEIYKKAILRPSTPDVLLHLIAHKMVFENYNKQIATPYDMELREYLTEYADELSTEAKIKQLLSRKPEINEKDYKAKIKLLKEGKYREIISQQDTEKGKLFYREFSLYGMSPNDLMDAYGRAGRGEFYGMMTIFDEELAIGDLRSITHAYLFIKNPAFSSETGHVTPDTMQSAENSGHDGMVNLDAVGGALVDSNKSDRTERSPEIVAFKPSQVKLHDLITRDVFGRIIPPSQRFDESRLEVTRAPSIKEVRPKVTQAPVFEEGEMSRGEAEAVLFALHKHAAIGGVTRYGDGILRLQDDEFVLSVAPEALPLDAEEQARMSFYGDVPPTLNEVNQAINFLNDVGGTGLNFRQYLSAALPATQAALESSSDPTTPEEEKSRKELQDQVAAIKEAQEMISMLLGQSTKLDFDATPQGEWLASSKDFNDKYRDVANNVTMHSENHVGAQMMHMWGDFDESGQFSLAAVSKDILRGSAVNGKPTTDVYIPLNRKAVGLLRQAVNYTSGLRREIGKARAIYESNNPTKSWESLYSDQKLDRSIELIADKVFAGKDGRLYLKVPSLQQIHGTDESGRKAASLENSAILKTLAYQEAVSWHDQYQEGNFDRDSLYGSVLESDGFYTNIATRMGLDKPDKINTFDKLKKAIGHKDIFPTSDTKIPFLDTSAAVRALPSEFTEKYTRAVTEAMDEVLPDNHPYKKWISQLKSEFANIDKSRMSGTDRVKAIDNTRFVANNLSSFSLQFARQMASVMWMNASGSHKMRGVVGQLIDLGLMAHFDKSYNATGKPSGFRVVRAKSTADLIKNVGLVSETEWDNMLTDLNALSLIGVKQGLMLQLSEGDTSVSEDIAKVDGKIEKVSGSVMSRLTSDERTDTGQSVVDRAYSILSSGFDRFADRDNTALTKRTVLLAHIFDADTTAMRKFVTETINEKDSDLDAAIYEKLTQMVMSEIKVKNGMQDLAASILTDIQYKPMPVNENAAKQDVMSVLGSHDLPFEYIHKFIDDVVDDNGNINREKVGESVDGMLSGLREDYRKNREQLKQAEASIEDADSYQIARVRAQAELYRRALDRIERNANTLKEMLPTLQYSGVTLGALDESQYRDFVTLILNNDSVNVFSSSNEWAAYSVNDSLFSSFGTSEYESGGDSITSAPLHPVVSDFFAKYDNIPIITYNSSLDWRKVVGTKGSGLVIDADGEVAAIVHDMDNPYSWRSLGNQIIDYTLSRSLGSSDKAREVLDTVRGVLHRSQMATLGDARVTRDSRLSVGTDKDLMLTTDEINRAESMNETYTTHVQGLENELLDLRRQKYSLQRNPILLRGENVDTVEADFDRLGDIGPRQALMEERASDMETAFKQKEFDQQKAKLKEDIDSLEEDIQGVLVDLNKASITALKEQNIKPNDNPYFQFSSERKANMLGVSFADPKKVEALRADTIEAENARSLSLDKYFDGIERQIARLESELASEDTEVNEENLFSLAAETSYEGDLGMVGQTRLAKHAKAKLNDLKAQRSTSKARRISKYKHSYKMADWQISIKEIFQKIKNGKSVFSQIADIAVMAETLSANADSSMDRARAAETAKKMSEVNDALQIEVLVKQLEGYEQIVKVYDVGFKRRDKKVKDTKEIKGHRAKMLASKEKANSLDKKITNLKKENKDTSELESKLSDQNRITEHHTQMGKILTSILQQHNPTKKNPSPDMSKSLISRNEAERMVDKLKARITRAVNVGKDTELDGDSLRKLVSYTSNALMPLAEKMIRPVTQEVAYRVTPGSKTKRDITKIDNVLKRLGSSSFMRMSNHELLKAMITSPELIQLLSDLPEQDIALMESAFRRSYVFKKGTKSHIEYMTSLFTAMEQTLISNASKVDVTFDTVQAEIDAENEAREEEEKGSVDSTPNTYARGSMVVLEETGYTDTQRIQAISGLLSAVFHSLNNPDAATDVSNANSERWEVIQEKVKSRARGAGDYDAALEQEIEALQAVELYQKTYAGMESVSLMRYLQRSSGGKTYIAIPQTLQDRLAIKKSAQAINGAWDNVWGTSTYDEELAKRLNYIKGLITHPDTERLGKALLLDEINKGGDKLKPFAQLETSDLAPYIVHKNAQIDAVKSDYVNLGKYTIGDSPVTRSEWLDYRIDQLEKKIGENTRTHAERLSKYNVASDMTLVHHMWSMDQASQYQTDKPLVLHAESISEKSDVVTAPHILIAAGIHQRTRYVADKINNIKKTLLALNNNVDPFTEALMKFSDQAVFDADAFADSAEYIVEQMQAIQGTHNTLPEGKTKRKIQYTTVLLDKLSEMFIDENGNIDGSDVKVKESIRLVTSMQTQLNTSTLDTTVDDVMEAMPDLGQKVDWKTQPFEGDVIGNIGQFFRKYRGALGATTSNESLDRFADSIRFLGDISTEIKRDETEIRGLEIQRKKMETMRDNVRFETDVLPSEGLDMIINHWLARTRSESRTDALGIERIQYKDLLPKKAGKISYAEQTEALKDASELIQNILEESDEGLPSPYERAVLHGGLGSVKSRSKGLGGLEPTRAVVLPSRIKKPVVLSPGQLPKESRLYNLEEVDTFVGDTLVGEITSDFSYFLYGSQPLDHEARQFSRWVKKSMIANNDVFSDLAKSAADGNTHAKNVINQMEVMLNDLIAITDDVNASQDVREHANFALKNFSEGDLRSAQREYHVVLACVLSVPFMEAVRKGSNPNKAAASLFGEKGDRFAHIDAKIFHKFSRDIEARKVMFHILQTLDDGIDGKSGRNAAIRESKISEKAITVAASNLGTAVESYEATMVGQVLGYIDDDNLSPLEMLEKNLSIYESSKDTMLNAKGVIKGKSRYKRTIKKQIKVIEDLTPKIRKAASQIDPSLTKEQFFDELEVKLFEMLNEDQINFIQVSRQEFKDRYDSLAAVMAIQGRELGRIHNYLPITSYRRDDSDKNDFILNMQYTPDGSYGRSRYEGDEETAINLDGASTFDATLASMSYSINTTTTYSAMGSLFGGVDTDSEIKYESEDERPEPMVNKFLEINGQNNIYADDASVFAKKMIIEIYQNDNPQNPEDGILKDVIMKATELGYKQGLLSLYQPIRQTVPVVTSYTLRNMLLNPRKVARFFGSAYKLLSNKEYKDAIKEQVLAHAPSISFRALDGNDVINNSVLKSFRKMPLHKKAGWLVALPFSAAWRLGDKVMNTLLGKPDQWLMHAMIATEYEHYTGDSLADENASFDPTSFAYSRAIVEGTLAQSDKSKKAQLLQSSGYISRAASAFSNHVLATASTGHAGLSLVRNSTTLEGKREGLSMTSDFIFQTLIFTGISTSNAIYFIAKAIGESEEEEEKIQKELLDKLSSPISKDGLMASAFNMDAGEVEGMNQILGEVERRPMDSQKFFHRFFWRSGVQATGVVSPRLSLSLVNRLLEGVSTAGLEIATGKEFTHKGTIADQQTASFQLLGASGVAATNTYKYIQTYATGDDWEDREFDHRDVLYLASQILYNREQRYRLQRDIQKRDNVPVWDMSKKKGEPLINIDGLLDKL